MEGVGEFSEGEEVGVSELRTENAFDKGMEVEVEGVTGCRDVW